MKRVYRLKSKLWIYPSKTAAWHFLTIAKTDSTQIQETFGANSRGWGSLPVVVKVGKTTWKTSIFPDRKAGTYLLPVKAAVRRAEALFADEVVSYQVKIR